MNDRSGERPDTLDQLLDAAERICSTTASSEITMRRIATEAGVSPGLAYHYVSSKDDLIGMLLMRMGERLSRRTRDAGDPRLMLESLWEALDVSSNAARPRDTIEAISSTAINMSATRWKSERITASRRCDEARRRARGSRPPRPCQRFYREAPREAPRDGSDRAANVGGCP